MANPFTLQAARRPSLGARRDRTSRDLDGALVVLMFAAQAFAAVVALAEWLAPAVDAPVVVAAHVHTTP